GGVHDGDGIVNSLLVGASAVELCSVIFDKGASHIKTMKDSLEAWMNKHNYNSIADFKGKLNAGSRDDADMFERTQFIKYFGGKE
ncbi:MAG: diguanylate cyclase, partial [Bacteroidales bacterium]|nr:diguanylate cyclase [Bacteroidales bacterium]